MKPAPAIVHFRAHDYGRLIKRWRAAARAAGLSLKPYASASGYELFVAETRKPRADSPWIYLSAGIHGDEPAGTEALVEWMAARPSPGCNLLVFPCLNPWGLVNNSRVDEAGRDLNRSYHDDAVPQTAAHRSLIGRRKFRLAMMLHEDYDANGIYLYEIPIGSESWGAELLEAASPHVPVDTRKSVEGRRSRSGLIRAKIAPDSMLHHPEAFVLHFQNRSRTFTVETPSEARIDSRVAAQIAVIEAAVARAARVRPAASEIYKH